ncbi:biotin/lipoyl-binding protein [Hydrogenivirga sp. 128-5-R1-1]|uniref:efflux RND transporter periplasmic adaptor subunit n=1 Tax=Hydrogenivirga sp. 128-5-R1-1 TaxID=392423 RepID=UPI00015EF811|nr:biotin/lipoyl-binding protein [Hydrogenivirga sp. 128-5-R1-1]EDP75658.1 hypothetical protein HG1285_16880 [Hydrogenivirga sp. 128-5-R1-1]
MRLLLVIALSVGLSLAGELNIYTVVIGKVSKVYVREGDRVKKGQPLMEIDPALYLAEKHRLMGKRAEINARMWKVERDYRRLKELFERDLLAETRLEDQKIKYDTLKAQLQQVEGELKRVETLISYTVITSPVGGRVVKILAPEGSYVNGELQPQPVMVIEVR